MSMDAELPPDSRTEVGLALIALNAARLRRRSPVSLTALSTLATLEREGPHRVTELAAIEGLAQPSMTSLVNGLQRNGLVARHPDPTDRRAWLVTITVAGLDLLHSQRKSRAEEYADLIAMLAPEEILALANARHALRHLCALANARRSNVAAVTRARYAREAAPRELAEQPVQDHADQAADPLGEVERLGFGVGPAQHGHEVGG